MIIRENHVIPDELDGFSINDGQMLMLDHVLCQVLVNKLPERPPFVSIEHDKEMVLLCYQVMRNIRRRPMAVDVAFLFHSTLDNTAVRDDCHCRVTQLKSVETPILTSPFGKSVLTVVSFLSLILSAHIGLLYVCVTFRNLVEITNEWQCPWAFGLLVIRGKQIRQGQLTSRHVFPAMAILKGAVQNIQDGNEGAQEQSYQRHD